MLLSLKVLFRLNYAGLNIARSADDIDALWGIYRCDYDFRDIVIVAFQTLE